MLGYTLLPLFLLGLLSPNLFHLVSSQGTVPPELFSPLTPQKVLATYKASPSLQWPQYTDGSGRWLFFPPRTWTSGFFPATLYALNTRRQLCGATDANQLGIADWVALGRANSRGLPLDAGGIGHDVGFISFPFVEELVVNPQNQTAKASINSLASALAARFDGKVGCTRSWDSSDPTDFQVIIDNMMNLEVLFVSADLTGNQDLKKIAISHALTTMNNHVRPDGSSWHVVEYNQTTGKVIRKRTAQGYSDNSTWARGQAWGIYGFANMHRLTGNPDFLSTSRRMANYFLDHLPQDGVVPWDFQAPLTPAPRPADSSAAALVSNALLLLAQQETDPGAKKQWTDAAIRILNSITRLAWKPQWQSLLSNGTVNWPANNYLTGIVYGDYYYIKAANELIKNNIVTCEGQWTSSRILGVFDVHS